MKQFECRDARPQANEELKKWNIVLTEEPVEATARKLHSGHLLMGSKAEHPGSDVCDSDRIQVDATSDDVDRKIQTKMFSQPTIK